MRASAFPRLLALFFAVTSAFSQVPAPVPAPNPPPAPVPAPPVSVPTPVVKAPEKPAPERERKVYVPFDELEKVFQDGGKGVFLPYREFLELWNELTLKRAEDEKPPPADAVLAKAEYTGRVEGDSVVLDAKISVESFKKGWVMLPLTDKAAPGIGEASTGKAVLRSRTDGADLLLPEKGVYEITLKIYAPIVRGGGKARVTLHLPRAAVSRLTMSVPGEGLEFDLKPAAAFTAQAAGGQTQFSCFFGAGSTQEIAWGAAQTVTQMQPLILARSEISTQIGTGSVATKADIAFRILRAPVNELKVSLPAEQEILGVTGIGIKEWKIDAGTNARKTLVILPEKPLRDDYKLQLELEGPVAKLPAEVRVPEIEIVGAAQANGTATIGAESQLDVTPKTLTSAARSLAGDSRSQVGAFRLLRQPYVLSFDVAEAKPQVEAASVTKLTVRREAASLTADFTFTVRRVGIFETRLAVPAGWTVSDIKGQIDSWSLDSTATPPVAVIKLPKQTAGEFKCTLTARQTRAQATADVTMPVFAPQGVTRHEALIGATIHSSLEPNTKDLGDFQQEDVSAVAMQGDANATELAFRYRDAAKPAVLGLKSRSSQVSVEVLTLVEVKEQAVRHTWTLAFDIAYAAADRFVLAVPKSVAAEVRFVDPQVKEINKDYKPAQAVVLPDAANYALWEVVLRGERQGALVLSASVERPVALEAGKTGSVELLHVHVPGAFQETGQIAVVKADALEIRKAEPETLEEIDARELRSEIQRPGVFLAYKYRSLPIKLGVELAKNSFIQVPRAIITHADLTTAVATDDAQVTEVVYWVKNNDQQFLVVRLPKGGKLNSDIFVNREAQQPMRREGSDDLLVRLPSGDAARTAFPVRFVLEVPSAHAGEKFGLWGGFSVSTPQVDEVGIMQTRHRLFLPEAWHYTQLDGPLTPDSRDHSWRNLRRAVNYVLPSFGPQIDVDARAYQQEPPDVPQEVRGLYGFNVSQQGHLETLRRLGPPATTEVGYRSAKVTFFYQAAAFFVTLLAGLRCWQRGARVKLLFLALGGLGAMLLTGLLSAANVPVAQAVMLAVAVSVGMWFALGFLSVGKLATKRFTRPKPPEPPPPPPAPEAPAESPPPAPRSKKAATAATPPPADESKPEK
ncbi:MAG: hypothetical protein JNG86_12735 [Verrucomicrobiaceae bacterium]|nr:hypothetical protein [Verrucomicrobiaceae bacterium]